MLPDGLIQWISENCVDTSYPLEFWIEFAEHFSKLSRSDQEWLIDFLKADQMKRDSADS